MASPGRMAGTGQATLRHVDFLVLAVLSDEEMHGYGIVRAIERISDGSLSLRPGDVYRVLYRMQRRGLLEPAGRREAAETERQRRTYYRITEAGRRVAAKEAELMATVAARLLAKGGGHAGSSS